MSIHILKLYICYNNSNIIDTILNILHHWWNKYVLNSVIAIFGEYTGLTLSNFSKMSLLIFIN